MKNQTRYTDEQLDFLRIKYLSMNVRDLTKIFNRKFGLEKTESAIQSTLKNHSIKCGRDHKDRLINRERLFTKKQIQFLRDNYAGRSISEMTDIFNAQFKTSFSRTQIKTAVHNRGITSGRTGCFEKGNKPWNAGTKGQGLTGANKGSFKKGSIPPNRKPLGSERVCPRDGFISVKISKKNPYTGSPTRYKHKHVHIWEQANGPVSKGYVVAFKNGDKTNCDLENLMMISRAELLCLNNHGYKDIPAELKPSMRALVKLKVATFERGKKS